MEASAQTAEQAVLAGTAEFPVTAAKEATAAPLAIKAVQPAGEVTAALEARFPATAGPVVAVGWAGAEIPRTKRAPAARVDVAVMLERRVTAVAAGSAGEVAVAERASRALTPVTQALRAQPAVLAATAATEVRAAPCSATAAEAAAAATAEVAVTAATEVTAVMPPARAHRVPTAAAPVPAPPAAAEAKGARPAKPGESAVAVTTETAATAVQAATPESLDAAVRGPVGMQPIPMAGAAATAVSAGAPETAERAGLPELVAALASRVPQEPVAPYRPAGAEEQVALDGTAPIH